MKRLALLLLLAISCTASAAITRVQEVNANSGAATATSLVITFGSAPTSGNIVLVGVATGTNNITISSNAGISWSEAYHKNSGSGGVNVALFIGRVFGSASATITLATDGGSPNALAAVAAEYSGVNMRMDRSIGASGGTNTTAASGAASTTNNANELWVGVISASVSGGTTYSSPTNSFSIVDQVATSIGTTTDRTVGFLEQIVSSTGAPNAGATIGAATNWSALVATFEETPTSGGTTVVGASYPFVL